MFKDDGKENFEEIQSIERHIDKDAEGYFYNRYLWLLFSIRSLKIVDLWLRRVKWTTANNCDVPGENRPTGASLIIE